ncbi:MAG: 3-keto-5-aminohexanoate cleavage protein [Paracoccaceae bacterium]|nr:MAG: 3-keto-5-aminohexanoate cleavage protein [Paracoccaceae bacterium]
MRWITCAVNGGTLSRADTPHLAITPAEIAADALAAAAAGAAVVHIHVRDPATGQGAHDVGLYVEVAERIRERDPQVLIHFTGGGGGTLPVGLHDPVIQPADAAAILSADRRLAHLGPARADMTGLDCGSFSWGDGGLVFLSPTDMLYRAAALLGPMGVRPELTVFDLGQMALAARMMADGAVPDRTPVCIGFGVLWCAPARPLALEAMLDLMPAGTRWTASSKGDDGQRALAPLIVERGGGLRTGIEDHHLWHGEPVTNAYLVEQAVAAMARGGAAPATAPEVRGHLGLARQ